MGIVDNLLKPDNKFVNNNSPLDMITSTRLGGTLMRFTMYFMRILGWGMVLTATVLISGVGYLYFFVILPMLFAESWVQLFMFFMGVISAANVYFNYYACQFVSPGEAPKQWIESIDISVVKDEDKTIHGKKWSKYCNKCHKPKAPRAHHCYVCGKCVLRMDHHCPWVNTCVGYNNHRYFILFLFHLWWSSAVLAALLFMATMGILPVDETLWYDWNGFLNFVMILCASLSIMMTGFLGWHVYLILSNQTTIEFQFNKLKQFTGSASGTAPYNMYDLGLIRNYRQVFGEENVLKAFFVPHLKKTPLDGVHWPNLHTILPE